MQNINVKYLCLFFALKRKLGTDIKHLVYLRFSISPQIQELTIFRHAVHETCIVIKHAHSE